MGKAKAERRWRARRKNQIENFSLPTKPPNLSDQFLKDLPTEITNDFKSSTNPYCLRELCKAIFVIVDQDGVPYARKVYFPGRLIKSGEWDDFKKAILRESSQGLKRVRRVAMTWTGHWCNDDTKEHEPKDPETMSNQNSKDGWHDLQNHDEDKVLVSDRSASWKCPICSAVMSDEQLVCYEHE